MGNPRRRADDKPGAWVVGARIQAFEVDFDLELNALDDRNAGFVHVEADTVDTEAAVFDLLPREVKVPTAFD